MDSENNMAPRRGGKEPRGKEVAGKNHGANKPALHATDNTPPKALRTSPRLREKKGLLLDLNATPTGVGTAHIQTPTSINSRPKKKLETMFDEEDKEGMKHGKKEDKEVAGHAVGSNKMPAKVPFSRGKNKQVADEGMDDPKGNMRSQVDAEPKGEQPDSCKEAKAGTLGSNTNSIPSMPLPYVEVFLPDGRLARQCSASDECPKRFHFELKRWRMEQHLKREHGLEVHIPLQKVGRPSKAELNSKAKAPQARVDSAQWHKLAKKRFEDKDRKFAMNVKKAERLHRLRAVDKWEKLKPEFRTMPKEAFVERIVKERMTAYLASSEERLARIQKRINEGYESHVS